MTVTVRHDDMYVLLAGYLNEKQTRQLEESKREDNDEDKDKDELRDGKARVRECVIVVVWQSS